MNATPMTLSPAGPAAPQGGAGRQADAGAGTPFSQVLSDEIAQQMNSGESTPDSLRAPAILLGVLPDAAADLAAAGASADASAGPAVEPIAPDEAAAPALTPEMLLGLALAPATPQPVQTAAAADTPVTEVPADALAAAALTAAPAAAVAASAPIAAPGSASAPAAPQQAPAAVARVQAAVLAAAAPASAAAPALDAAARPNAMPPGMPVAEAARALRTEAPATAPGPAPTEGFATHLMPEGGRAAEAPTEFLNLSALRGLAHAPAAAEPASAAGPAAPRIAPEVGSSAWGQALGEKIMWMAAGAQQTASLTLNPPNLGPLQVVLNIANDQASASFFAAQPEVRQALEAALPRLREMMSEAGIQLGQASVSADTPGQNQAFEHREARPLPHVAGSTEAEQPVAALAMPRGGRGLVDTFA